MKFLLAVLCLAAAVVAEPEADAGLLYGGYAYGAYPAYGYGYGAYGYGYPAYGYGGYYGGHLIGKRDAEPGLLAYTTPYVYTPYIYRTAGASSQYHADQFHVSAHSQIHKREAEPQGVAVHPGLATSSTYRSVQGAAGLSLYPYAYNYPYHFIGKRDAEPGLLAYTTPYVYTPYVYRPAGVSHQSIATPFHVSAHSQIHKREAEPQGVAVHPGLATSSTYRSVQGAAPAYYYPYAYNYYPTAYGYAY